MRQVGIFGKRKSGKSALLHALRKTDMMGGTNFSAVEIAGVGKIMLVDTVGVDAPDSTAERSAASIEVALMLIANESFELELAWLSKLRKLGTRRLSAKFQDWKQFALVQLQAQELRNFIQELLTNFQKSRGDLFCVINF